MKLHEKYLITEGISANELVKKLRKKYFNVSNPKWLGNKQLSLVVFPRRKEENLKWKDAREVKDTLLSLGVKKEDIISVTEVDDFISIDIENISK